MTVLNELHKNKGLRSSVKENIQKNIFSKEMIKFENQVLILVGIQITSNIFWYIKTNNFLVVKGIILNFLPWKFCFSSEFNHFANFSETLKWQMRMFFGVTVCEIEIESEKQENHFEGEKGKIVSDGKTNV